MFADNRSLFSTVTDPNPTANQINNNLHTINTWSHQWKINFNAVTCKQTYDVTVSRKIKVTAHPQLAFNNNLVYENSTQKSSNVFRFEIKFSEAFWEYAL